MSDIRDKMLENMNKYKANRSKYAAGKTKTGKRKDTFILFDNMLKEYMDAGMTKDEAMNKILDRVIAVSML